jgi:hypothetical protein
MTGDGAGSEIGVLGDEGTGGKRSSGGGRHFLFVLSDGRVVRSELDFVADDGRLGSSRGSLNAVPDVVVDRPNAVL